MPPPAATSREAAAAEEQDSPANTGRPASPVAAGKLMADHDEDTASASKDIDLSRLPLPTIAEESASASSEDHRSSSRPAERPAGSIIRRCAGTDSHAVDVEELLRTIDTLLSSSGPPALAASSAAAAATLASCLATLDASVLATMQDMQLEALLGKLPRLLLRKPDARGPSSWALPEVGGLLAAVQQACAVSGVAVTTGAGWECKRMWVHGGTLLGPIAHVPSARFPTPPCTHLECCRRGSATRAENPAAPSSWPFSASSSALLTRAPG